MSKETIVNDANFENEVIKADKPVLVDFWAEWCGPCRILGPVIEQIAEEYSAKLKVCKCNVDENPQASEKYGIMSIPCIKIFKNGKVVKEDVGAKPKEAIVELFKGLI